MLYQPLCLNGIEPPRIWPNGISIGFSPCERVQGKPVFGALVVYVSCNNIYTYIYIYTHILLVEKYMTVHGILQNPEKRTIIPTEYMGVKLVSFGFAGQGRAIMRGPMVSGVIDQLLTTTEWYGSFPILLSTHLFQFIV